MEINKKNEIDVTEKWVTGKEKTKGRRNKS